MKRIVMLLCAVMFCAAYFAQAQPAVENLPISVIVEDMPQPFPANAKVQLTNKVNQMLTTNGIASYDAFSGFFITAIANPVNKDIVPGAPAMISQALEVTFYIADYHRQLVFSTYTITTKGVGQTEAKSYLDAFKRVKINTPEAAAFIKQGRDKIVNYYDSEAESIFMKARQLAQQHDYEAALFELSNFPTACKSYAKSIEVGNEIYQGYIDYQAQQYLQKAKAAWMAEQNTDGAKAAGEWLSKILPEASCYSEAVDLYKEIKGKVLDDWKFEMKKYEDTVEIKKQTVTAWKEVGVAYGKNQQPTTTNIAWLK